MVAERNPEVQKAAVKLMEFSADEKARYIADLREKEQRDIEMWKDYGVKQGMEQGIQQGIEQGREQERERWQSVVAGKDAELTDQKAEIERLRALIGK